MIIVSRIFWIAVWSYCSFIFILDSDARWLLILQQLTICNGDCLHFFPMMNVLCWLHDVGEQRSHQLAWHRRHECSRSRQQAVSEITNKSLIRRQCRRNRRMHQRLWKDAESGRELLGNDRGHGHTHRLSSQSDICQDNQQVNFLFASCPKFCVPARGEATGDMNVPIVLCQFAECCGWLKGNSFVRGLSGEWLAQSRIFEISVELTCFFCNSA